MPTLYRPRRYALVLLSLGLALLLAVHAGAAPPPPQAVSSTIVISQFQVAGGTTADEFVEIHNISNSNYDLNGHRLVYRAAAGTTDVTLVSWTSSTIIPAGRYYLLAATPGYDGSTTADVTFPDSGGNGRLAGAGGGLAIRNGPADTGTIIDSVGYGTATNAFIEGTRTTAPTANNSMARKSNGCQDTDNNSSDFEQLSPSAPRNSSSPAQLCGAESAPYVSSTTPANGATGVAVNADIIVNFSEPVNVSGAWYTIDCNPSGPRTATVSGGPTSFTLNPDTDFTIGDVCTVVINHTLVTDQDTDDPPDQMADDYTWSFRVTGACTTIPLIQGAGNASSCLGTVNNIQGCITGIAADGFYLQDVTGDGNAQTSDGIYVYRGSTWDNPSGWAAGDLVSVSGQIIEYYNNTEFQSGNTVTKIGTCTLPTPVTINPVSDPTADPMTLYERFESMRVQMTFNGWVVGPTKRFTSRYAYGDPEIAFVDFSSSIPDYSRVFHSDYPGYQGINYLNGGLNFDLPNLDFGDTLAGTNVTGVLGYQFDKYTLLVDAAPALNTIDQPDVVTNWPAAEAAKREFDVCFYNVENLFDNYDDGKGDWGDWAPGWPTPDTPAGAAAY